MRSKQTAKPERTYPALEEFIEQAPKGAPAQLFAKTRERLSEAARGPRAAAAKRALAAVDRVQSLLDELLELRESLAAQRSKNARR
jgi:hypothetical protein